MASQQSHRSSLRVRIIAADCSVATCLQNRKLNPRSSSGPFTRLTKYKFGSLRAEVKFRGAPCALTGSLHLINVRMCCQMTTDEFVSLLTDAGNTYSIVKHEKRSAVHFRDRGYEFIGIPYDDDPEFLHIKTIFPAPEVLLS